MHSCGGFSDASKVLQNEKITNTDEFLVKKRDPLILLRKKVESIGALTSKLQSEIEQEAKLIINEATQSAENAPYVETSEFYKHVYSND